jgi:alpha-amylase
MKPLLWLEALALAKCHIALAASVEDWQSRSIYQVVTDRYAREDGSTTASCNAGHGEYCGGTYKGLTDNLDYIQDLGFTAVRH